jgi:hypothetical protein
LLLAGVALLLAGAALAQAGAGTPADDARAVALLQRCVTCHGGTKPEGGLNLTTRALALKGGASGVALTPGDPEHSLLLRRIVAKQMPPGSPLTAGEIALLRRWIAGGAAWPDAGPKRAGLDWWSLRPLTAPVPPVLQGHRAAAWVQSPIDAFVLAKLQARGLSPAPPADRVTLIRRVTFDLLGVPPTPGEIDRFLADRATNAYARLVDRLLADPRYGERWGRHWLDVARFGESHGFERDQFRPNAWRYRDYVIGAFNQDKPYARFILEQIAGDVLTPHTQDGIVATGFLVAGPWDEVGETQVNNVMKARVREEEREDMVGTVCQTFLGLTVNCARCHDHKFDPISQRDYYRVRSALDGVSHGDRSLLTPEEQQAHDAKAADLRQRISTLQEERGRLDQTARARLTARSPNAAAALAAPIPMAQWTFEQDASDLLGALPGTLIGGARIAGGRLLLDGKSAFMHTARLPRTLRAKTLEAWVVLPDREQRGGAALSVQTPGGGEFDAIVFGEREPGKWAAGSEFFHRTRDLTLSAASPGGPSSSVHAASGKEDAVAGTLLHVAIVYRADSSIAVYRDGQPYAAPYTPTGEGAALRTFPAGGAEVLIGLRHEGAANGLLHGEVEEARLYDRALTDVEVAASFRAGVSLFSPETLRQAMTSAERRRLDAQAVELQRLERSLQALEQPLLTYAASTAQPEVTRLLPRGDVEHPGEIVAAAGLSCLRSPSPDLGLAPDAPEGLRRLKLAAWIADPANPLTARVLVNRVWHYHFGRGIVGTPNDFGFNGERPTQPELLDWLASVFLRGGGRLKPLQRLILLSSTYRQSARFDPDGAARDAEDRLLWRFPPRRLEGEAVRDAMLCVSGLLNPRRGGPSFQPFTVVIDNSHFYHQFDSPDPEYNRRTVYRAGVNSAKNALLEALDCPDPSTKTPRRDVTTTPLQALELMNNTFVLRQAHGFAAKLEREGGPSLPGRIILAYRLAFGRRPSPEEAVRAEDFVRAQGLENLCWALLNANEFLYLQ